MDSLPLNHLAREHACVCTHALPTKGLKNSLLTTHQCLLILNTYCGSKLTPTHTHTHTHAHTSHFPALHNILVFYKLRAGGKSIGTIFPTGFAYITSVCHILVIIKIFHFFIIILFVMMISDQRSLMLLLQKRL